ETKNGVHQARSATALHRSGVTRPAVTAYAVRRPDKQWALLAINKNPKRAARLEVQFNIAGAKEPGTFVGQVELIRFSRQQYVWPADSRNGYPTRSLPPAQFTQEASSYELPPYSLTVIRGRIAD